MRQDSDGAWPPEVPGRWPVSDSVELAEGRIVSFRMDTVRMPDGHEVRREYVEHPGAVVVVPVDEAGRVLMIRQYRHAAGWQVWEVPAGLRDVPGEPPLETAKRELAEEAGYRASRWQQLTECYSSPGISTERLVVYLARDLEPVPASEQHHQRVDEEAHLLIDWVPLDLAVSRFLAGQLRSGVTAIGVLAAYAATMTASPQGDPAARC